MVKVQIETNVEALISGIGAGHDNTDDAPQVEVYRELRELAFQDLAEKFKPIAVTYSQGLHLLLDGKAVDWTFSSIHIPEVGDTRLSRKSLVEYTAPLPAGASSAIWSYDSKYGDAVVHFTGAGNAAKTTYWLVKGESSPSFPLQMTSASRHWTEVAAGLYRSGLPAYFTERCGPYIICAGTVFTQPQIFTAAVAGNRIHHRT